MAILKVAQMGHPILRKEAAHVKKSELKDPFFQKFIDDMIETMREYDGVGLAAPQVHVSKKVVVVEAQSNPRYPDNPTLPLMVFVNPEITRYSPETAEGWEGCLSLSDLRGKVKRSTKIHLEATDRKGKAISRDIEGFLAIVLQHEIDHLNKTLFVDRMSDMESLSFLQEYERFAFV